MLSFKVKESHTVLGRYDDDDNPFKWVKLINIRSILIIVRISQWALGCYGPGVVSNGRNAIKFCFMQTSILLEALDRLEGPQKRQFDGQKLYSYNAL